MNDRPTVGDPTRRYVRARNVVSRSHRAGTLVHAPHLGQPLLLAGLAVAVWDGLARPQSLTSLATTVATLNGPIGDGDPDVAEFVGDLIEHGLVSISLDESSAD